MNTDIRIQDDLFGHVNGAWLDTAEIPGDRSSWGPFVMLADTAEEHVREIIEALRRTGEVDGRRGDRRSATCSPASWTRSASRSSATPRSCRCSSRSTRITDLPGLATFLGSFERRGGGGLFGSYVDTDDRNSDRYVVNVLQGGIGLPDETYYREEKFAEIREKYVAYLERILTLAERPDPAGTAAQVARPRDPAGQGALGARRDPRRHQDLQPDHARGPQGDRAELRLRRLDHRARRHRGDDRGDRRTAAVVPRPPRDGAGRHPDRGLARVPHRARDPHRRGVPLRRVRRGQLRLLRPHPLRHPRAARPVEAGRRAWSRARSARPSAASTSPGTSRRAPRR